jgi:hypothetical protein
MTTSQTAQQAEGAAYQPQVDETCLVTFQATLLADRANGVCFGIIERDRMTLLPASRAVRVEPLPKPALPTTFGSRISAVILRSDEDERIELVLADPTASPRQQQWMGLGGSWRSIDELTDVVVLHDAGAPAAEVAEVAEPEPLKLPTAVGTFVVAKIGADSIPAVLRLVNDEDGEPGASVWTIAAGSEWVADGLINEWVLLDADGLRIIDVELT